jgi:hypothetical protein
MSLTAEQYQHLVASLDAEPATGPGEKRTSRRQAVHKPIEIIPCILNVRPRTTPAMVRDVSARGIAVEVASAIPPGNHFTASFLRDNGDMLAVLFRVARCQPLGAKKFLVGGVAEQVIAEGRIRAAG